ncbi:MAG: hypothetical protein HZA01_12050 [Nitrospinae bacterium]|nr:hypothetical protein [Nitrospinota bacterium]
MVIRTNKQKDNFAKFLYDIAKIDFAAFIIAQVTNPSAIKEWVLVVGIFATILPLIAAIILDGKEIET